MRFSVLLHQNFIPYTSHLELENFVNYVEGTIDLYYFKVIQKEILIAKIFKYLPIIF
jgi:hypothetical protein